MGFPVDESFHQSLSNTIIDEKQHRKPISSTDTQEKNVKQIVVDNFLPQSLTIDQPPKHPNDDVTNRLSSNLEPLYEHRSQRSTDDIFHEHTLSSVKNSNSNDVLENDIIVASDTFIIDGLPSSTNDSVEIVDVDLEAFNPVFVQQRHDAINNTYYRTAIESWKPAKLRQLVKLIRNLSKTKPEIDCYWIIFYWIACNITFDAASYFNENFYVQSAKDIFHKRTDLCIGLVLCIDICVLN
ncbi:hypothetical protein I4U23_008364 [Adineta vaga]|nr:hypothetical protein I4U23_008364 [Adineta vaga]